MSDNFRNKFCTTSTYRVIKEMIIPILFVLLGLLFNSKIGKDNRHLKMVELLNEKIGGSHKDIEYLNNLLIAVDKRFAKKLKKNIDRRSIELSFKDFNNDTSKVREAAINNLAVLYSDYPDLIIDGYINMIPDNIKEIKWGPAISIAKGMSLLGEWKGDRFMLDKVRSFQKSTWFSDTLISKRIEKVLKNYKEAK